MDRPRSQRMRPVIEPLEERELPSGIIASMVSRGQLNRPVLAFEQAPIVLPSEVPYQGSQPTLHELRREAFRGVFAGPFVQGAARFQDQTSQIVLRGTGGATMFLHGNFQMQVVTPSDPSKPLVGTVTLQDKNISTSGILIADLTGIRSDTDAQGRPTHLTLSFVPFAGSGSFNAGSFSLATGQGTVDIHYLPSGRSGPGVFSQGKAILIFRGAIYVPGTADPLRNALLQASHHKF
jgi:hypothetical protein